MPFFMPTSKKIHIKHKKAYANLLSLVIMLSNFMDTGV
ncbi:Uncharacterised protein [Providencia heimbachae]|uniref:Uncharacterized protein n=1 Tax=Providencia heimbachae ATCC 35613 TaxID=1354272 RepID=A0A1B7JV29_9GAMM|nr:hypothetical protein M998_1973 [Providencia heimbachae ATCC 35613]SQH15693.1 Uncharacterised protein [Providencia heimbachae]